MKPNRIAFITGASSGIGMAFARRFARLGYDLIITGRRQDKLVLLAEELKGQFGIAVKIIIAELSDEKDVQNLLKVIAGVDNIYILVNNAGYGSGKEFCECALDNHLQMLQVHVVTTVKLVHAVLPQMISRRYGTIINVSSIAAYLPTPCSCIYSSSKQFLKNFTESLHMEVSSCGIKLQCLCPGFTHTDFHQRNVNLVVPKKYGIIQWMEADTVVYKCLKSLEKGKIIYVPGLMNRLLTRIIPFIPSFIYYRLMMKIVHRASEIETVKYRQSKDFLPVH